MIKKVIIKITAAFVIAMSLIGSCLWFLSESGSAYYYTQIDNRKIEQVNSSGGVIDPHGGMPYSYTLPAYNESGAKKDITFGTEKELKEGAFIRLTVAPIRGVLEWTQVQRNELPAAVQRNYAENKFN